jgi:hypothetical protein
MTEYEITCKACGDVLSAETEDEFVEVGQAHAAKHGHAYELSRQHILGRLAGKEHRQHGNH